MGIYHLIPKDRYITRKELENLSGLGDRAIRREISRLCKDPETPIISSSHGKGYKRPASVDEIDQCIWECKSRINDEQEKVEALYKARRYFKEAENDQQMLLDF